MTDKIGEIVRPVVASKIIDNIGGVETKRGNYLSLTPEEAEAIKQYAGYGNVVMNMLFNTDIDSVLQRLQYWARADENIGSFLDIGVVNNVVHLYGALLKSFKYHSENNEGQDHTPRLYRGSTGIHHSDGFKSFTGKKQMAESFGNIVFEIAFPAGIPFLSGEDINNYAPHTSRREEDEYLFSPFCNIDSVNPKDPFSSRISKYKLSKKEIDFSIDSYPDDINENLSMMAKKISEFRSNARTIEGFERWQVFDSDYEKALQEREEIRKSYQKISEEVLNFIKYQCARLEEC